MPRPTAEQLAKINQFTHTPLTEENCYVFDTMAIDDMETSYCSVIHPNLLNRFHQDAMRGVGLLMNHNSRSLPVGRSFDAQMKSDFEEGKSINSLYISHYMDLGRRTESGMTTDDLAKGIDAGTVFDTSIGFSANSWKCSICGNDIRDWSKCDHFPGEKYAVTRNGQDVVEKCLVIVGEDGDGELIEDSLVYAGACNRATIKRNFSVDGVTNSELGTKLHLVENFKNIPVNATIYGYYTKDGSILFTDTDDRTDGAETLRKRSDEQVELQKLMEVLNKFNLSADTEEGLSTALQAMADVQTQLNEKSAELETVKGELANATSELDTVKSELSTKDTVIAELNAKNEELTEKAQVAETYRQDLVNKALDAGVRAQGNAFNRGLFEKFLGSLSIAEIKEALEGFENEFNTRFAGSRTSEPQDRTLGARTSEPKSREDFEDEVEFRNFVADKATEYAKENNVSIAEATKLMMKKYTTKESDE